LLKCPTTSVVSSSVAYQITDILSDNSARAPAFGTHSVLNIPSQQVAVKTGTTNSLRDNWTFGFTSDYLVATWVGNNDNTPMSYVASGITGASPIWNSIFTNLLDKNNPHHFTLPSDLIKVTICPLTGTLTCAECPNPKTEYFKPGTEPKKACTKEIIQPILEKRDQLLNGITTAAP
jgi:penicillin-binding protein 1C